VLVGWSSIWPWTDDGPLGTGIPFREGRKVVDQAEQEVVLVVLEQVLVLLELVDPESSTALASE
jgi:hypothetical protein